MLSDPHLLQWLLTLIGLVAVMGALVLLAQRYGQVWRKKFGGELRLVDSFSLDTRYRVVVVEDKHQRHTLVLGPQQATLLSSRALHTPKAKGKKA